jgi:hypothetical protein
VHAAHRSERRTYRSEPERAELLERAEVDLDVVTIDREPGHLSAPVLA